MSRATVNVLELADRTGATSSQAAIDAALASLAERQADLSIESSKSYGAGSHGWEGGELYLPAGVYDCQIDLTGLHNIQVRGDGPATVIHNTATDGSHAITSANPTSAVANRPVVRDLMVVGNPLSGDGVHFEHVDYPIIDNVWVQSNGRDGIHVIGTSNPEAGVDDRIITNVYALFNGRDGFHLEQLHDTYMTTIHAEENERYGIYGYRMVDLELTAVNAEDHLNGPEIMLEECKYLVFTSLQCEGETTITLVDAVGVQQFTNCQINDLSITGPLNMRLSASNIDHLTVSAPTGDSVTGSLLDLVGCYVGAFRDMTLNSLRVVGGYVGLTTALAGGEGATRFGVQASFEGADVHCNGDHRIQAQVAHGRLTINGGNWKTPGTQRLAIDGNGLAGIRHVFSGVNVRTMAIDWSDIAALQVDGNLMYGGVVASTISGAATVTKFTDNILANNYPVTVDAGLTGTLVIADNVKSGSSITDNTGNRVGTDYV